jgi:hypothetical protein
MVNNVPWTARIRVFALPAAAVIFPLCIATGGCSPDEQNEPSASPVATLRATGPIEFPDGLRVDDPTVNEFILKAIETCVSGDYEAFRLLWTARQDPLSEQEFKRGWAAVQKVRIDNIRPFRTPEGEIVYAARAHVQLDPAEVPEPDRDIVLLLVKESEQWRLAPAPPSVREELKKFTASAAETQPNGETPATQPDSQDP